ncbi:uncharacterized protein N7443_005299 [Penicillium atrosanguineum]|uniref:uncharacterized protein n=1 Tax=Penicillium atrosanguineum TaxID=1132637 RepID=UPI0023A1B2B9|nr:uncharacterized protein N7443_005299 [Penicillium atrosanguineum]KAJ5305639.1 hypothetical protein N7443_005299 [Penicillium atrosanguineum]
MASDSTSFVNHEDFLEPHKSTDLDEEDGTPIDTAAEVEADTAITSFIESNSRIPVAPSYGQIACPVVVPQRRPGNKERGFMKAYAPILFQYDITQEHFHDFIKALNKAVQASKWIAAVQIAAFGASFVPNQISMGTTAAVQIVSAVAAKAQIRWKVNTFIDKANRELFCPRGLYCMIVTYNPLAQQQQKEISTSISRPSASGASGSSRSKWPGKVTKNLRNPFSATTEGEQNLPSEIAPLIFSDNEDEKVQMKMKEKPWDKLNDYYDKRARARYASESNRDALSSAPESKFKNRFLDPNHPASNGGLLGLISGGHLTRDPKKIMEDTKSSYQQQERLIYEQQDSQLELLRSQFQAMGFSEKQQSDYIASYEQQFQLQRDQLKAQIKGTEMMHRKILRNVLYLMVVNLPTEEEVEAARMATNTDEEDNGSQRSFVTMVNVQ